MERLIFKNKITKGLALFVILCLAACAQPAAAQTDAARRTEQSKPYTPAYEELLAPGAGAKSNADDMVVPLKPSAPSSAAVEQEASEEEAPEAPKTPPNEVFLDADEVSYGENTGLATAEGNVKITNKQVRLFAPYAEYNANTNIVDAYSDHRENVVIFSGGDKFTGKHLKYNMETRRGVLTQVSGKSEAMYMQGGTVKLMPLEDAIKQGIVNAPRKKKSSQSEDVAEWLGVTSTTCDFTNPHYRLVSKKVIVYPGKKTVIKKPKFYIGKTLIMPYPFDYIINSKKNKNAIMPIVRFDSNKGMGFGIKGPVDMGEWGELDLATVYWTNDIWEAKIGYQYEITDGLTAFAATNRLYNSDEKEILWRPNWGVKYAKSGWEAKLWWSERELVTTEMVPGYEERFNVWRKPEFLLYTPWVKDGVTGGQFRGVGIWGTYQDNRGGAGQWIDRYALGVEYNGNPTWSIGFLKPFYGARYMGYHYSEPDQNQDVSEAWFGFNYKIGAFDFNSYYFRRWVGGASPMGWDAYSENKDIYQTVGFPLPLGASWEKWYLSVTAAYNYITEEIGSMRYTITYDKHCMTWQAWYLDNRSGDEKKFGLTFFINAYPEYKLELGSDTTGANEDDF
ncbi:MAG: hypothetical protein RR340_03460 [Cloacibacillus sp.]